MGLTTFEGPSGALCGAAKYFKITAMTLEKTRKTRTYVITNLRQGVTIGTISWYGPWRQYAFEPEAGTVWSVDCMESVGMFIEKLKEQRRKTAAAS